MKTVVKSAVMIVVGVLTALTVYYFTPHTIPLETATDIAETATDVIVQAENGCDKFTDIEDLVAYLKIPNTDIDDAVVQASDNSYYLRRNKYGNYSFSGCYFADYECDMTNLSQNTIVYGHNLRDESRLFGQLTRFKDVEFYKKTPVLKFDIKSKPLKWKIFACFITNNKTEDGKIFYYLDPNFDSQEDFLEFVKQIKRRSLINTPVDVKENDKILLLSTCDYQVDNDWRCVVASRLIRDGESEEVDVESAVQNPDPLYPDGWYRRFGGSKPIFND